MQLEQGKFYRDVSGAIVEIESELANGNFQAKDGREYHSDGIAISFSYDDHLIEEVMKEIPKIVKVHNGYEYDGVVFRNYRDAQAIPADILELSSYLDNFDSKQPITVKDVPEYMNRKWHLDSYNEGYEIHYIDSSNFTHAIRMESGDTGHSKDLELLQYIIKLHNTNLDKIEQGIRK
jgi:hypothetical protein